MPLLFQDVYVSKSGQVLFVLLPTSPSPQWVTAVNSNLTLTHNGSAVTLPSSPMRSASTS